ncbi:MAG: hypothetical protein HY675_15380 [Chloroflexi bacterium]|nr:hypothetical protein [Chloroflexota bacterium]
MRALLAILALAFLLSGSLALAQSDRFRLSVVETEGAGGGTSAGGTLTLHSTIGQWDTNTLRGDRFSLAEGFWSIAGAQNRVLIPRVFVGD